MSLAWLGRELEALLRMIFGDWLTTPEPMPERRRRAR